MKAILEYELPENEEELKLAVTAQKAKFALDDFFTESLRKRIKYSTELNESQLILLTDVRNELIQYYKDRSLENWIE